jgi:signal transduction histidine kinase
MTDAPASVPAGPAGVAGAPWFARLAARLRHRRAPDLADLLIAVACFAAFSVPVLAGAAAGAGSRPAIAAFGALAAAPLVVRRRWPLAVLVVLVAVYVASTLAGVQFTPFVSSAGPNLAIAVFTVADLRDRRTSLLAYGLACACTWAVLPVGLHLHPGLDQDAVQAGAMIPGWFLGDAIRTRRRYAESLAREARRQAAETEARIRAEERLRLSRDVHDVVSHSLSMIAVRSGVARLVLDREPGEARSALSAIETASRSALDEVRLLLRQIREPSASPADRWPGLADLPELVRQFQDSGLRLRYRGAGEPAGYGEPVELSAYRIAQEALTNVARHAASASAVLRVDCEPGRITLSVTDDGPGGGADTGTGLGLAGMRERVALHGGEFRAGPRPGGGFEVHAVLPAAPAARAAESPGTGHSPGGGHIAASRVP